MKKNFGFFITVMVILTVVFPAVKTSNYDSPPTIIIESPEDNSASQETGITIIGYAEDDIGLGMFTFLHEWMDNNEIRTISFPPGIKYHEINMDIILHEGWNKITITVTDTSSQESSDSVTVFYDLFSPRTTINVGNPYYEKWHSDPNIPDGGWFDWYVNSETPFAFTAWDPGNSGVENIYYRTCYFNNWSEWIQYNDVGFNLVGDGLHWIEYYAVDYAGNIELTNNFSYFVDDTDSLVYQRTDGEKHVSDFAFICAPHKKASNGQFTNDFLIQGLYAYFVLIDKGYEADHIRLVLGNDGKEVDTDEIINELNTSKLFSTKGKINVTMIKKMKEKVANQTKWPDEDWMTINRGEIWGLRNKIIEHFKGKEGEKKINVIFYYVGHGSSSGTFSFPDSTKDPFTHIQSRYFWEDYTNQGGSHSIYHFFEEKLKENDIECKKIVCLFDFCYSGHFVDKLKTGESRMKNKIAVSSSSKSETSLYNPNIGSYFFNPFWKSLHAGKSISDAYKAGKKIVEKNGKNPQIKPANSDFVLFKSDPITSQTKIILDGCDDIQCPILNIEDDIYVLPVGLDYIKYRIDGGEWTIYEEPFTIESEGIHTLECYSADLLGNTGDIDEYNVIVDETPPSSPDLLSPSNHETSCTTTPNFDWTSIDDVSDVYYTLQISTDAQFSNIVYEHVDIMGSYYPIKNTEKLSLGSYFWRVCAIDGVNHISPWSETWSFTISKENSVPEKPNRPEGIKIGEPGEQYTYSTVTNDGDGDKIRYIFYWGDGKYDTTLSYNSGETISYLHTWTEKGEYNIKVKAIDEHGYESEWSDPLSVSMPKNKAKSIYTPFLRLLQNYPVLFKMLQKILLF